jgi:gliding motility-associatede transport system auxiliary component
VKIVRGNELGQYKLEQMPDQEKLTFTRKLVAFQGEMKFTEALLAVTNPKPLLACFLQGHGEPQLDGSHLGYMTFINILQQNYIHVEPLSLLGTNVMPADCSLLIVAGPVAKIPPIELDKIEKYLNEGGKLFALFNAESIDHPTGLEDILAKWGVKVGYNIVKDFSTSPSGSGQDMIVSVFAPHPVVDALMGYGLYLVRPRVIARLDLPGQTADTLNVKEIAFTSPKAFLAGVVNPRPGTWPLMVAVEKSTVKGIPLTDQGPTRILVVGDSLFLSNDGIVSAYNRDFVDSAVSWLLDRTTLLQGIGPQPVSEYRVRIAHNQMQSLRWILLAAMPGGALVLGGLVWLRRRQ